jgi:hypothetical protein
VRVLNYRAATAAATYFLFCLAATGAANAAEAAPPAADKPSDAEVSGVVVFGRGEAKIGVAQAASEGTVAGSDLLVRPLLRVAELVEAVPGMIAAQHSGSGKANQYFLRGFNLDHGSDFTTYIDGVQMNFRTHGHGQGYLDLNGLIPEVIDREDFRKGPYRADGGDFALAGAAYMTTIQSFDRPWMSAEAGSYGYGRLAGGGTIKDVGGGDLTFAGQTKIYNGPWELPERMNHFAGFVKYDRPTSLGNLELTGHAYQSTWKPTEQIPERIIGTALCPDVFCSPDPSAKGETTRFIADAKLSGEGWRANVYSQFYNWNMYSNPTYANPDGSSAQIHQFDRRWVFGMTGQKTWFFGDKFDFTLGAENRYDDIGKVGVQHTDARQFVNSYGLYKVKEASAALYGEATWRPITGLRITGGLRGDYYHASIAAIDAEAAALGVGKSHDSIVSPKVDVAYKVNSHIELYGDWGRGFHSNDVRGSVQDPPVPMLVRGTGKEVGARFQISSFTLTTTYWWLNVASELRFVGDSNAVEPSGASRRHGYELVAFWRPFDWLAIDANYTGSHARYDNGDHIPNAFENSASVGVSYVSDDWEGSIRMRHLGPSPLIEDNSVRDKGSTVFNIRGARKFDHIELYAEVLNVANSRDKDIAYYYESYIPSFDAEPVDGRLSRVVEPRTFRIGAKYKF